MKSVPYQRFPITIVFNSYVTKDQVAVEFVADAYASAIATRPASDHATTTAEESAQAVAARVRKIVYNVTGKMQVAAPLACSKLLKYPTPSRTSEVFAPLQFAQLYNAMKGQQINTRLIRNGEGWVNTSFYHDYIYRPVGKFNYIHDGVSVGVDFDSISPYEFVRAFQVAKKSAPKKVTQERPPPTADDTSAAELDLNQDPAQTQPKAPNVMAPPVQTPQAKPSKAIFPLHQGHPQSKTHHVIRRPRLAVPTVIGPRLPDNKALDTDKKVRLRQIKLFRSHLLANLFFF